MMRFFLNLFYSPSSHAILWVCRESGYSVLMQIMYAFVGCKDPELGRVLKELFQTSYFRIVVVPDEETVELCGALKV